MVSFKTICWSLFLGVIAFLASVYISNSDPSYSLMAVPRHLRDKYFQNRDGLLIYRHEWKPQNPPIGVVILVHGINEHLGRYDELAKKYVEKGFYVTGVDIRGHGRSQGDRGYFHDPYAVVDEILQNLEETKMKYPKLDYHLVGHSLGSLLSLALVEQAEPLLTSLTLSGTCTRSSTGEDVKGLEPNLLWLAAQVPKWAILPLDERLCTDPVCLAEAKRDPLMNVDSIRLGSAAGMVRLLERLNEDHIHAKYSLPVLQVVGESDKLCLLKGAQEVHEIIGSTDKELATYPLAGHEVFREPRVKDEVMDKMVNWVVAHSTASA